MVRALGAHGHKRPSDDTDDQTGCASRARRFGLVAARAAAVRHAECSFPLLATALDPITWVEPQLTDREF